MSLARVLAIINRMQADGVIESYAIGGAVGATFYLEPVATVDLDVFIAVKPEPGRSLVTLEPVYQYFYGRGARAQGEYILIEDWPVQFLVSGDPLVEEALASATVFDVDGEPVRVFSAEHLAAIALQVGRPKDKARLLQFVQAGVLDEARLEELLEKHALTVRWRRFVERFLGDES